jgi:hypothetical protein
VTVVQQVKYLGHVISGNGVATDLAKIEAIISWPLPKSVTQLNSFVGLTGYYKRFIQSYSSICIPLHNLLKKDAFKWTPEHTNVFNTLKNKM